MTMTEAQRRDHGEAMLAHGWTCLPMGREAYGGPLYYEWRSPRGVSGSDYGSSDGNPTEAAIADAIRHNDYLCSPT